MAISNYYVGDLNSIGQQMGQDRATSAQERIAMQQVLANAIQQASAHRGQQAALAEQRYATDSEARLRRELAAATGGQAYDARHESARQFDAAQRAATAQSIAEAALKRDQFKSQEEVARITGQSREFDPRMFGYFSDAKTRADTTNLKVQEANQRAAAAADRANQMLRGALTARDAVYNANTPYLARAFRGGAYDAANLKGQEEFNKQLTGIYTALLDDAGLVSYDPKANHFFPRNLQPVPEPQMPMFRPPAVGPAPAAVPAMAPRAAVAPAVDPRVVMAAQIVQSQGAPPMPNAPAAIAQATNQPPPAVQLPSLPQAVSDVRLPVTARPTPDEALLDSFKSPMSLAPFVAPGGAMAPLVRGIYGAIQGYGSIPAADPRAFGAQGNAPGFTAPLADQRIFNDEQEALAAGVQPGQEFLYRRNGQVRKGRLIP